METVFKVFGRTSIDSQLGEVATSLRAGTFGGVAWRALTDCYSMQLLDTVCNNNGQLWRRAAIGEYPRFSKIMICTVKTPMSDMPVLKGNHSKKRNPRSRSETREKLRLEYEYRQTTNENYPAEN